MIGLVSWVSQNLVVSFNNNCHWKEKSEIIVSDATSLTNSRVHLILFLFQGLGCSRPDRPGVYARLSTAYDWIRESMCDLSEQPPPFCQPLELPEGWIEKVRVDVEYDSKPELSAWTLFDDHHNPIIESVEDSVPLEGLLVSTYVDIFEVGKYEIETINFQGKIRSLVVMVVEENCIL